jgi:hypothetical protein
MFTKTTCFQVAASGGWIVAGQRRWPMLWQAVANPIRPFTVRLYPGRRDFRLRQDTATIAANGSRAPIRSTPRLAAVAGRLGFHLCIGICQFTAESLLCLASPASSVARSADFGPCR